MNDTLYDGTYATQSTDNSSLDVRTIEKLCVEIARLENPKRLFVISKQTGWVLLNYIQTERKESLFSFNITFLKTGFRYGHLYFLTSRYADTNSVVEVLDNKLKEKLIKQMEGEIEFK